MQKPKKVLCIMDMAGFGRSSMAVVLPVLSACGVQACPLPTALYSTHMGGFGKVTIEETSAYAEQVLHHYKTKNIEFDAIYTGFLQGDLQFALAEKAQKQYPDAFILVDPAMGDHGKLYSSITMGMVEKMKKLCNAANLVTPNYTEVHFLLGLEPKVEPPEPEELQKQLKQLSRNKTNVVATSVPFADNGLEMQGYTPENDTYFRVPVRTVPQNYPGTGDLFASALLGLVLQGVPLHKAVPVAGQFVESSIQNTFLSGSDSHEGVWFEPQLYRLSAYVSNWKAITG